MARSISEQIQVYPTTAESIAALHGVLLGHELGVPSVIFEGDAKQVVQAVNAQEPCNCIYGHIVEGIQDALKGCTRTCFTYIAREGNCVAHGLAKEAILHVMDTTWRNDIPPCIHDIVQRGSYPLSMTISYVLE